MGLTTVDNNAIFLSTFDGFFEHKIKEPRPGSVQRVNKNGVTINVMRYNTLVGKLTKVEFKTTDEYGDFWSLTVVDDHTYKLDLPVNSPATYHVLNKLLNADLNLKAPMEFKVFGEVEGDKKRNVILVKQGGKMINGVYTKENPQDLPQMKQVMFKGKLQWDSTERDLFLKDLIEKYVIPELDGYVEPHTVDDDPFSDGPQDDVEMPDWVQETPPPTAEPPKQQAPAPPPASAPAKAPAKARGK